jgi:hypothetical protein
MNPAPASRRQLAQDAPLIFTQHNCLANTATYLLTQLPGLKHPNKMSRPGSAAPRNLTLTEELEKLEQSITLTLQGSLLIPCVLGEYDVPY